MRKKGGVFGTIFSFIVTLALIGVLLAVFSQFNWDFGLMVRWILEAAWSIITSVRDTVSSWDTFQRIF